MIPLHDQWIPQGPLWGTTRERRLCFDDRGVALAVLADERPVPARMCDVCTHCGAAYEAEVLAHRCTCAALTGDDWNIGMWIEHGLRALHRGDPAGADVGGFTS